MKHGVEFLTDKNEPFTILFSCEAEQQEFLWKYKTIENIIKENNGKLVIVWR